MGLAAPNVINLEEKRRKRLIKSDIQAFQSQQDVSPSTVLSFNIANLVYANLNEMNGQKAREKDPDMQAALYFARARLYYMHGRYFDAGKIFQSVLTMAESKDLRTLALLSWANCLFSQGEYIKAKAALEANLPQDKSDLPDAIKLAISLAQGNIALATDASALEVAAYYRKVSTSQSRSLWAQSLQQALATFNPVNFTEHRSENLKGLRNMLDAFLEIGASRYFASLVLTFS